MGVSTRADLAVVYLTFFLRLTAATVVFFASRPLGAQSVADSASLGVAVARTILAELRPATHDSKECRVDLGVDSVGEAVAEGFRSAIARAPGGEWVLSKPDFHTPRRSWKLFALRLGADTAVVSIRYAGSGMAVGLNAWSSDAVQTFVRNDSTWRALGPLQETYHVDMVIASVGRATCDH